MVCLLIGGRLVCCCGLWSLGRGFLLLRRRSIRCRLRIMCCVRILVGRMWLSLVVGLLLVSGWRLVFLLWMACRFVIIAVSGLVEGLPGRKGTREASGVIVAGFCGLSILAPFCVEWPDVSAGECCGEFAVVSGASEVFDFVAVLDGWVWCEGYAEFGPA